MGEHDLINLYSKRILGLAASVPHAGRLSAPMGSASVRAPLCGSTVTVDLDLEAGHVSRFAQDVRACALGQAAAAVVGNAALGLDRSAFADARQRLAAMLSGATQMPDPPFADLEVLAAARSFPNRHASILLSLDATLAAIDAVAAKAVNA